MHRPFLLFAVGAVLPAAVALLLTAESFDEGLARVRARGHERIARMTGALLGAETGERLHGLRGDGAAPAADPEAFARIQATTGYRTSLYVDGRRVSPADGPGPAELPPGSTAPPGLWLALADREAVARDVGGEAAGLVVLASPGRPPASATSREAWLPGGLLLLFALVAGWILLTRGRHEENTWRPPLLLACLFPLAVTGTVLAVLVVEFDRSADALTVESIARAFAVIRDPRVADTPEEIRRLTGLHATRVGNGSVTASTLDPSIASAVAGLRLPPPGFTTSGRIRPGEEQWLYLARRDRGGTMTVLSQEAPVAPVREFRLRALRTVLTLTAWTLLFVTLVRPRQFVSSDASSGSGGGSGASSSKRGMATRNSLSSPRTNV